MGWTTRTRVRVESEPEPGFESKPEPGFDPTLIFTDPKRDFFFNSGLIFLLFLLVCQILGHFHPNLLWPNWEVRFDSANQDPGKKYRNWDEIRTESCKNIWLKATKSPYTMHYMWFSWFWSQTPLEMLKFVKKQCLMYIYGETIVGIF